MNPYNPYQAPQMNDPSAGMGSAPHDSAMATILDSMKKTRPWVMFLSILGFLAAGAMITLGLLVMVAGSAMSAMTKTMPAGFGPALGLIYIIAGSFYVVPALLMWRYAAAIGQLNASGGSMEALAGAVQKQTTFWRFVGIFTAVMMVLYVVAIVIGVIVGVVMAVSR